MIINQLEPSDLKGFCHWVHPVLTLATAGLQGQPPAKTRAVVQAFISEIQKTNRILKMACRQETVLLSDFLKNLPNNQKSQDELWSAIKEAPRLYFIVVVKDPASVRDLLPGDWGRNGYPNVCLVLMTDDSPDRNRENIAVFKEIPAHFRALWIETRSQIKGIDNWHLGISWVIIDTTEHVFAGSLTDNITKWADDYRKCCEALGIPLFHNPPGCSGASLSETQLMSPEHPFPAGVDLRRQPLITDPSGQRESENPRVATPVEIAQPTSSVDASEFPISQPVEPSLSSSEEPATETEDCGPALFAETELEPRASAAVLLVAVEETSKKRARFLELDDVAKKGLGIFTVVGQALLEIREDELWREGCYPSWDAYCKDKIGLSKSYVNRQIRDAEIACELQLGKMPKSSCGEPILPSNESQVRPLAKLEHPAQRRKAWKAAVKRAEGLPTAIVVAKVVCELMAEEAPPKSPEPSRKTRREKLICELYEAAEAESSWEAVRAIAASLKLLF